METAARKLRLGMVGGGLGSFVGGCHRFAARLDDRFELIAGAFSSDPERSQASAAKLRIAPERSYVNWCEMAVAEARLPPDQRLDAVSIVTPNHLHRAQAEAFLDAGFDVICDKPMTTRMEDALALAEAGRPRARSRAPRPRPEPRRRACRRVTPKAGSRRSPKSMRTRPN